MKRKAKTIWCYLDGKKHCDVVQWALAANVDVREAKERLTAMYPIHGNIQSSIKTRLMMAWWLQAEMPSFGA